MARPRALLVVVALAAAACSATTPHVADPTPDASPSPTPAETPTKEPEPPPKARFAVYTDGGAIFFYDVRRDRVAEVATGRGLRLPRWVSRREISFLQDSGDGFGTPTTLRMIDLKTGDLRDVLSVDTGMRTYAWSPDRSVVAYVTVGSDGFPRIRYQTVGGGGGMRPIATLARILGRERHGGDQERIEWSRDGRRVLVVFTPADGDPGRPATPEESQLQVRSFDGTLLFAADHEEDPTMGFWSPGGARAYFRTVGGARFWGSRDGRVHGLAGSPRWFDPWQSPDGNLIAYDTGASGAGVRTHVYDVRSGGDRTITGPLRASPVFATTKTVWVQAYRRCPNCLGATEPEPEVFAVNLRTNEVTSLAIRSLQDVDVLYR